MALICTTESASHSKIVGGESIGGVSVPLGAILGLIGGLTYALYSWSARKMMLQGTRSSVAMGATFGLGGLLLMPVLVVSGAPFLASWTNAAVGVYMAAVPMFLGYVSFGYGLARVQASMATVLTLLEPVVAAVLAAQIGNRLHPGVNAEIGRDLALGGESRLRPYVEARAQVLSKRDRSVTVSLTDFVQGIIMVVALVVMPFVVLSGAGVGSGDAGAALA